MKLTTKRLSRFLELVGDGHTVKFACLQIKVTPQAIYYRRSVDPAFAVAWDEAKEQGIQTLEEEAMRRAVQGTEKMVVSAGKLMGTELQHSDTLLIFLLKAMRPEVYRDNVNVEVYIRKAALEAGIDPDAAVAEAQAIVKEAKAR